MSFDSVGYAGSVGWAEWAQMAKSLGADYAVAGETDLAVTIADATAGTVRVAPGSGTGRGVTDTMVEAEEILSGLTTPSTWYTIVLRRDWTGGPGAEVTSLVVLAGGSSEGIAPGRQVGAGVVDDQPLALVQRGASGLAMVRDLRCWWGNGGVAVASVAALAYLGAVGSVVRVDAVAYERRPGGAGWTRVSTDTADLVGDPVPVVRGGTGAATAGGARTALGITADVLGAFRRLWGRGAPAQAGSAPSVASPFLMVSATQVVTTNAAGDFTIVFPEAFPNGLLSVTGSLFAAIGAGFPVPVHMVLWDYTTTVVSARPSRTRFSGRVFQPGGATYPSGTFRISYIALGW